MPSLRAPPTIGAHSSGGSPGRAAAPGPRSARVGNAGCRRSAGRSSGGQPTPGATATPSQASRRKPAGIPAEGGGPATPTPSDQTARSEAGRPAGPAPDGSRPARARQRDRRHRRRGGTADSHAAGSALPVAAEEPDPCAHMTTGTTSIATSSTRPIENACPPMSPAVTQTSPLPAICSARAFRPRPSQRCGTVPRGTWRAIRREAADV